MSVYFNRDYMPWLEEDDIVSADNLEEERRTIATDVVREDRRRFMRQCNKVGWNYKKALAEYYKEHPEKAVRRKKKKG